MRNMDVKFETKKLRRTKNKTEFRTKIEKQNQKLTVKNLKRKSQNQTVNIKNNEIQRRRGLKLRILLSQNSKNLKFGTKFRIGDYGLS